MLDVENSRSVQLPQQSSPQLLPATLRHLSGPRGTAEVYTSALEDVAIGRNYQQMAILHDRQRRLECSLPRKSDLSFMVTGNGAHVYLRSQQKPAIQDMVLVEMQ